jgi:uncharacterized membrane protein YdjX (TVP38/TMEM64 family)
MPRSKLIGALIAFAIVAVVILLGRQLAGFIPLFAAWVDSLGALGPVVFMAGYVVAAVLMVPGSLLTLAAGAIFGLLRGTVYVFFAASAGATAAFLVSRYVVRGAVRRRLGKQTRFREIDAAIEREGLKIVFLIRLSPLFPFNVTNYALGVTSIRLRDYVIACVGMLPVTILWVYYGRLIGDVASLVAGAKIQRGPGYWVVLTAGLVATFIATAVITRAAKRALQSSVDDTGEHES